MEKNEVDGERGRNAKNISGHLRKYLKDKYGDNCSLCGWREVHPITGVVPLEIDHIDGKSGNNFEKEPAFNLSKLSFSYVKF